MYCVFGCADVASLRPAPPLFCSGAADTVQTEWYECAEGSANGLYCERWIGVLTTELDDDEWGEGTLRLSGSCVM